MRIVGVDFSVKSLDVVSLHLDVPEPRWLHVPCHGSFRSSRDMLDLVPPHSWWADVALCAVEKPMSQQRNSISALMRMQGAILASIPHQIDVWEIPPHEWKKECGLAGNAKKIDVAVWALDHGADLEWSQDACDALAIATAALRINTRGLEAAA